MRLFGLDISIATIGRESAKRESTPLAAVLNESFWSDFNGTPNSGTPRALGSAVVYSCVRLISETVGSLPCHLFRRRANGGGKDRATDLPFYTILNLFPNPLQTRMELFEMATRDLLLRGNAYLRFAFDEKGWPSRLYRLHPDCMRVVAGSDADSLTYIYKVKNEEYKYNHNQIVHVRYQSDDGINGRSPLSVARSAFEGAATMDEFSSKTFNNGTRLSGILKHPDQLDEETAKRIAESFRKAYSGAANAGKVAVIEEGMEFTPVSMTLADAEFVESRKLSRSEICGIFGVPPPLIGDLDRATFSNIEHQEIQFVVHCIRNWLVRFELAMMRTLFGPDISSDYFIEFLADALLRGDSKTRNESYQIGLQNGFMTFNEVREKENMNPLAWGDATLVPANMKPVSSEDDLRAPVDTTKSTPAPTPTKKSDSVFAIAVRRAAAAHAPVFAAVISRALVKEVNEATRHNAKLAEPEFDKALGQFFDVASEAFVEGLSPAVGAFAEHLRTLADLSGLESAPLPVDFVPVWVADYCGRRFNDISAAPRTAREPMLQASLRKLPGDEAGRLCRQVAAALLGDRSPWPSPE